jgi:hypothetical protein
MAKMVEREKDGGKRDRRVRKREDIPFEKSSVLAISSKYSLYKKGTPVPPYCGVKCCDGIKFFSSDSSSPGQ